MRAVTCQATGGRRRVSDQFQQIDAALVCFAIHRPRPGLAVAALRQHRRRHLPGRAKRFGGVGPRRRGDREAAIAKRLARMVGAGVIGLAIGIADRLRTAVVFRARIRAAGEFVIQRFVG